MVSILIEKDYADSVWCKKLHNSLTHSLRQKRIPFCEIFDVYPQDSQAVFIIASDYEWVKSVVGQFNKIGVKPILLCNQLERIPGCQYSCVCSDINASMHNLLTKLRAIGNLRVALYGVNPNSISDIGRVDGLFSWKEVNRETIRLFTNNGSLEKCFNEFYPQAKRFDTVICTNDFAAVSLVKRLRERDAGLLKRLNIISCTKTEFSSCYDEITSIDLNFSKFGDEAVRIFDRLTKHSYLSCITSSIVWDLDEGKPIKREAPYPLSLPGKDDSFYTDPELIEMLAVAKYMSITDSTDRQIIDSLIDGQPYEKIAEFCFLTESGIKYRIKRILQNCNVSDKSILLELIKKYIKTEEQQ